MLMILTKIRKFIFFSSAIVQSVGLVDINQDIFFKCPVIILKNVVPYLSKAQILIINKFSILEAWWEKIREKVSKDREA